MASELIVISSDDESEFSDDQFMYTPKTQNARHNNIECKVRKLKLPPCSQTC